MACYGQVDVALDPLPYGGATTTCEALLMGVPVVSLRGAGMVGCLSASVLAAAGCSPWIADNETHYVAIAQQLAQQGPRQAPTRQQLRDQVQCSALGNGQRLAHALEKQCQALAAAALQRLR
jgi:predicted O-linked N-acetylglucosamine transferase (SPINDLY family)